jgi:hypothetical protein
MQFLWRKQQSRRKRIKSCLTSRLRQTALWGHQRPAAKTRFAHSPLNHYHQTRDHYHILPKLLNNFRPTNKLLVRNASKGRKSFRPNRPPPLPMKVLRVLAHPTLSLGKNRQKCMMLGKCIQLAPSLDTSDGVCCLIGLWFFTVLSTTRPSRIPDMSRYQLRYLVILLQCFYCPLLVISCSIETNTLLTLGNLRILAIILICLRYRLLRCLFTYGPT